MPWYLNGNTHGVEGKGPLSVVQEDTVKDSDWQEDRAPMSQSPHLLVTTLPSVSVAVAHQGTGESAYVHW
jgi:hypothetical protein